MIFSKDISVFCVDNPQEDRKDGIVLGGQIGWEGDHTGRLKRVCTERGDQWIGPRCAGREVLGADLQQKCPCQSQKTTPTQTQTDRGNAGELWEIQYCRPLNTLLSHSGSVMPFICYLKTETRYLPSQQGAKNQLEKFVV